MEEFWIFWICCIIITTWISSKKEQGTLGFFMGCIYGPLGIIIALASTTKKKKTNKVLDTSEKKGSTHFKEKTPKINNNLKKDDILDETPCPSCKTMIRVRLSIISRTDKLKCNYCKIKLMTSFDDKGNLILLEYQDSTVIDNVASDITKEKKLLNYKVKNLKYKISIILEEIMDSQTDKTDELIDLIGNCEEYFDQLKINLDEELNNLEQEKNSLDHVQNNYSNLLKETKQNNEPTDNYWHEEF
jgi:hypothetical protein